MVPVPQGRRERERVMDVTACVARELPPVSVTPSGPAFPARTPMVLPGGALLALAMSLRARGLRGLDVLRRSQDRAPPSFS